MLNIFINKEISGSNNLIELIRDSVVYDEDFSVNYNRQTIRPIPADVDGRNTAVNVFLRAKGVNISAVAFYKRPDISVVPDSRINPEEDLPVFLYNGDIELLYNQDNLDAFVRPLIKDRLNITEDSFRIENIDPSRWQEGLVKFDIVADQYSEVIVGKTHGFIRVDIPEHLIYDEFLAYGLLTPQTFASGEEQALRPVNKLSFFKQTPADSIDNFSIGNKDSEVHSSMIKSYINKSYTDESTDEYEVSGFIQNTDTTSTRFVKIKDSTEYRLFGKYKTRQFDPSRDFLNKHIEKWNSELEGKIIYNTLKERVEFYAYDDMVGEAVTLEDATRIQNGIYKEMFGTYGLPVDTVTMTPDFLREITADGVPRPEYTFRYDNSAIVKNGPYTIHIVYEKPTRCKGVNIFTMIDGLNSIGAIEGVSDGWSTGNIEWWQIDGGLLVDEFGNPITKPENFFATWNAVLKDVEELDGNMDRPDKKGGGGGGGGYGGGTTITPSKGAVKPSDENIEKAKSEAKYIYTDLDTITDPNLNGFIL